MSNTFKFLACNIVASLISISLFAGPDVTNTLQPKAPLSFIENKGQVRDQNAQARPDIQFQLKAAGGLTIFIGDGAIHYQFSKADKEIKQPSKEDMMKPGFIPEQTTYTMDRMDVELVGANKLAQVITDEKQDYCENYFKEWSEGKSVTVSAYNRITYKNIYPNIDWVLYTKDGKLEHEFVVRHGGKVSDIKLKYGGAKDLKINADGSLTATTPQGTITEKAPDTYQKDGTKVNSSFVLQGDMLSYDAGAYTGDLVIDPPLVWATYYGGSGNDYFLRMVTDGSGNEYMCGHTTSTSAIATSGAYETTYGGGLFDAILVKFNSSGAIQWATYYGGSGLETGEGVANDGSGNVYMTGYTTSTSGIATSGAYQSTYAGNQDAFLAKFNSTGAIQWATYYGGANQDIAYGVAIDGSGNLYISGYTLSPSGIATSGAYQTAFGGIADVFLAKFNSSGAIQWATYYGNNATNNGYALASDVAGNVYITGVTSGTTGIATSGAYQTTNSGGAYDGFLAKFNSSGAFQWGTYYGGSGDDYGEGATTDGAGNIYITGYTSSTTAIATTGAYQTTYGGGTHDVFLAKFNSAGSIQWATYYGGAGEDAGNGLASDASGNVYMTGYTASTTAIATSGAYQTTYGGGAYDACLAEFSTSGSLLYATYYGGLGQDVGADLLTDGTGNIYLCGNSNSTSGIATSGAYQTSNGGGYDAFLAKFNICSVLPVVAPVTGPTTVCPGNTITLSDATGGGSWSSGNGAIALVGSTGVVTGVSAGNVVISYSVTNSCGTTNALAMISVGNKIITTIAGNGTGGFLGDGGPATAAEINAPSSVAADAAGNVYIADLSNNMIRKVTPGGIISTIAGTGTVGSGGDGFPATAAQLNTPYGVAVDAAGNVYIADDFNAKIRKINTSGIISTIAGTGTVGFFGDGGAATLAQLNQPNQLAVDGAGNVYFADGFNQRVRMISTTGIISTVAGNGTSGFGPDGIAATLSQLHSPSGVAVDAIGNLYIADPFNNRIRMVNPAGIISTIAGTGSTGYTGDGTAATLATLSDPTGVSVDVAGNIYFNDQHNHAIRMINTSGIISTVSGTGTAGYSGDNGNPSTATMNNPYDVAVDAAGNIYIADLGNNRVRKIATVGTAISGSPSICQGMPVPFTDPTPGGTWTSSAPSIATVGSSTGIVTGVAAGIATITYNIASGCGSPYVTMPVTVTAFSAGTIAGPSTVCPGNTITLTDATGGGTWSSSNPAAATVVGGVVTGVAAGNTIISYTVSAGCTGYAFALVNVGNEIITTIAGNGTAGFLGDGGPATNGELNNPYGVAVDGSGNIYVAEWNNQRIRKISSTGILTTYAGTGAPGYFGDGGPATNAKIMNPAGVAVDAAGNVYFADYNHCCPRKLLKKKLYKRGADCPPCC